MTESGAVEIRRKPRKTTASGRPLAPAAARPKILATASLVLAAGTVFLMPLLSPATVLLGPFAWLLGKLDAQDAERRQQRQSLSGRLGAGIGRAATGVLVVTALLLLLFLVVMWSGL